MNKTKVSAQPLISDDEYATLSAVCTLNKVPINKAWAEGLRMFVATLPVQLSKRNSRATTPKGR